VMQGKLVVRNEYDSRSFHKNILQYLLRLNKYPFEPIISIEHFVDIDYLMRNNNKTGVGINSENKTCGQKNNSVKNSSSPGGTWLSSF
jgi:hypothetical protein